MELIICLVKSYAFMKDGKAHLSHGHRSDVELPALINLINILLTHPKGVKEIFKVSTVAPGLNLSKDN